MLKPVPVSKTADSFIRFIGRRPLVALLLGLAGLGVLAPGMQQLTTDFTYRAFFRADDPMLIDYDKFERQFGNDDAAVIGVHSPSGIFDAESIDVLRELTEKLWQVTDVMRVDSLTNFNWVHADGDDIIVEPLIPEFGELAPELLAERRKVALSHEVIPNYLVSEDGKTAMVFAVIKPGFEVAPNDPLIAGEMDEVIESVSRGDHTFYHTGAQAMGRAFEDAAITDMSRLIPIVATLTLLMLIVLLRRVSGVILALVVVVCSIVGALGVAGFTGVKMTNVTTMLPQLLIAVGIADAVHLLVSFYRGLARGMDRDEAAYYTMTKNLQPTLLTTISTAAGFFSFMTATLQPMADIGFLGGVGTLIAWAVTYLILGGIICMLPAKARQVPQDGSHFSDRISVGITDFIAARPWPVIISFTGLALLATFLASRNDINADPYKYFAEGYPLRVANDFLQDEIGGTRGIELQIGCGAEECIKEPAFLRKIEELQAWIDTIPGVTRTLSIVDILKQTNRSLNGDDQAAYALVDDKETVGQELFLYTMSLPQGMDLNDRMTLKNDELRVTVLWTITDSAETVDRADEIVARAAAMGLNAIATGKTMLWQGMNGKVVESFLTSITLAVLLISTMMIIYFRSIKLGLLALIPNVVPLVCGGAILYLMGKPLDVGTVMVYAVCLGIAVDDTIHMLTNYFRLTEEEGKSPRDAIEDVLKHTGPALLVTTLILVTAFGTFVFATFQPNLFFGVLTAIVLTTALATDLIFLPAILLRNHKRSADG